ALDDPVGCAPDAVRLEAGAHVAAVDLQRALEPGARGVVGLGDDDEALLRHLDRREVATHFPAAAFERLDLPAELALEDREVVPDVRMPGGDAHEPPLAAAADQDGRPADGLRLADGIAHRAVLALERRALLGPETSQHLGGLLERTEPRAERREGTPVGVELGGEPARTET